MRTIIVWFRSDLRIHDHPALMIACQNADRVIPVYILAKNMLDSPHASSNRNRFLLDCLRDLKGILQEKQADLVIREGHPEHELLVLAHATQSAAVYVTADFTPSALIQDKSVKNILEENHISFRLFPGRLIVSSLDLLTTKSGNTHKVFTPFWKNWQRIKRRTVAQTPDVIPFPTGIKPGKLPSLQTLTRTADLSENCMIGGERAGLIQLEHFLSGAIHEYHTRNNILADNATSRLSPYLTFGCLSPRAIEDRLPDGPGPQAWHRQLAWREFYYYILYQFPNNTHSEFQEKYRVLTWDHNQQLLQAWSSGQTGYPLVDAAMRQLNQEGWMHNRGRLIVGSFLTKDLWLDWRDGEAYFMKMLLDGDAANNNGNWQWIASVGVDPAPVYRRLYNPTSQLKNYDPDGNYTRFYVPELRAVPIKYLAEPWTMPAEIQKQTSCVIGKDYPLPIINHKDARLAALERYRAITS